MSQVCQRYDTHRRQRAKPHLRWRTAKALGWVPIKTGGLKLRGGAFYFRTERFDVWMTRDIPNGTRFGASNFSQDARGRWYLNVTVQVMPAERVASEEAVGIDLGLATLATLSNGEHIDTRRPFRSIEPKLAAAQRAKKKRRVRALHIKAAAQRRDAMHKASASLAKRFGVIAVGDVPPAKMAATNLAKSVYDAGWSSFRQMLSYKAVGHGGRYVEVREAYTTQTCSACGSRPPSRPKGLGGLRVREWACDACGAVHDRDVNAARNILRLGLEALEAGAGRPEQPSGHEFCC